MRRAEDPRHVVRCIRSRPRSALEATPRCGAIALALLAVAAASCKAAFVAHDAGSSLDASVPETLAVARGAGLDLRVAVTDGGNDRPSDAALALGAPVRKASEGRRSVIFPDGVGREILQFEPAFRACYAQGLARERRQDGSPIFTVTVSQAGVVASVNIANDGLHADVIACLTSRIQAATFDPVIGDGRTLTFQVTFQPGP
jgi:hypothetical protein